MSQSRGNYSTNVWPQQASRRPAALQRTHPQPASPAPPRPAPPPLVRTTAHPRPTGPPTPDRPSEHEHLQGPAGWMRREPAAMQGSSKGRGHTPTPHYFAKRKRVKIAAGRAPHQRVAACCHGVTGSPAMLPWPRLVCHSRCACPNGGPTAGDADGRTLQSSGGAATTRLRGSTRTITRTPTEGRRTAQHSTAHHVHTKDSTRWWCSIGFE